MFFRISLSSISRAQSEPFQYEESTNNTHSAHNRYMHENHISRAEGEISLGFGSCLDMGIRVREKMYVFDPKILLILCTVCSCRSMVYSMRKHSLNRVGRGILIAKLQCSSPLLLLNLDRVQYARFLGSTIHIYNM